MYTVQSSNDAARLTGRATTFTIIGERNKT